MANIMETLILNLNFRFFRTVQFVLGTCEIAFVTKNYHKIVT